MKSKNGEYLAGSRDPVWYTLRGLAWESEWEGWMQNTLELLSYTTEQ